MKDKDAFYITRSFVGLFRHGFVKILVLAVIAILAVLLNPEQLIVLLVVTAFALPLLDCILLIFRQILEIFSGSE